METIASWVATIATILGASLTASNLGARITGYGFIAFTIGSIAWFALGQLTGQPALVSTNVVMTALNLFGVWRWLGRQAQVEEGAHAASEASAASTGEPLFPASLLASAPVRCGAERVGTCVDAMVGCNGGRIAYVVVSEGGVAGVGETLRQVPWRAACMEGEELDLRMEPRRFSELEEISRDQWPAR